jgi:hypothetical protein
MGLLAVPTIRLKCAYALRHDCKTSAGDFLRTEKLE